MSAEILASSDETRQNLREAVAAGAYSTEQLAEMVVKANVIAGGAFAAGDLQEAYNELVFASDLIKYMISQEKDKMTH